jgi:hypothetical protein
MYRDVKHVVDIGSNVSCFQSIFTIFFLLFHYIYNSFIDNIGVHASMTANKQFKTEKTN